MGLFGFTLLCIRVWEDGRTHPLVVGSAPNCIYTENKRKDYIRCDADAFVCAHSSSGDPLDACIRQSTLLYGMILLAQVPQYFPSATLDKHITPYKIWGRREYTWIYIFSREKERELFWWASSSNLVADESWYKRHKIVVHFNDKTYIPGSSPHKWKDAHPDMRQTVTKWEQNQD